MDAAARIARLAARDQTFLASDTLALRGIAEADLAAAPSWYPSPYPMPLAVTEERIRHQIAGGAGGGAHTFVAHREADSRIVGSLDFWTGDWRWCFTRPWADPLLPERERGAVVAEMIRIAVPWLIEEPGFMAVLVQVPDGTSSVAETFAELGMRFAFRLREAALIDGRRRDLVGYQAYNPKAEAIFGVPGEVEEGSVEREVHALAPRTWPGEERPERAMMIGERVYLRAIEPEDAAKLVTWGLQEPEDFHIPRWPHSETTVAAHERALAEQAPPVTVRFAIVRRGTGDLIGIASLKDIDLINRSAETASYIFRAEDRNQGFGTEAKHLLLGWGFDRLGLHMVWSAVWEPNARSAAALRKQGYRLAGWNHWRHFANGRPYGEWIFDLLADEWRGGRVDSRQ